MLQEEFVSQPEALRYQGNWQDWLALNNKENKALHILRNKRTESIITERKGKACKARLGL